MESVEERAQRVLLAELLREYREGYAPVQQERAEPKSDPPIAA